MKNNRIRNAYDSINPGPAQKQQMLDAILSSADLKESPQQPRRSQKPVAYTAKQSTTHKQTNIFGTLAAGIVLVLVVGFGISFLMNRESINPVANEPTSDITVPMATAGDHYAPVLGKYRRAMAEGWTKQQCEIEGISTRIQAGYDVTKAGFAMLDLDGDGREELLIAEESTDRIDNIWDFYTTLEDGTPIQLWVDEQDGGQCRLYEDNVISISYSNKHELELTFYDLESGKLVMREMLQWEDEDTVFHTDAHGNTRQVTSKEGQSISYAYENQKLNLTWLADIPDYIRNADALEQYTPILEKYKTALLENWTWEQCDAADISRMILFDTTDKNNLGWCLMDLDNNGTDELVISDGNYLFDLYVMLPDHEIAGHLLSAYPYHYTLCKDGSIERREHENEVNTYWRWFFLSGPTLVEQEVLYHEMESHQYSYGSSDNTLKTIPENDAGKYLTNPVKSAMKLNLTPFAEKQFPEVREPNYYYEPLIETYRQAIRENWNPGQCMENGISLMIGYYGELYDTLGHNQYDLNGDGNDELIITDGTNIYDLYTVSNGEVIHLASAMERKEYFVTTDGYIYEMGSGSYAVGYYSLYTLGQQNLVLERGFMMDAEADPGNPWFYYDGVDKGGPCSTSEAAAIMDTIHFAEISFIPFG